MVSLQELTSYFEEIIPILGIFIKVILAYLIFNILLKFVTRKLRIRANTKKQISNVEIITQIFRYIFIAVLILFTIFSFTGSLTGLGLTFGFISAAIGFALQRPITGLAAWVMVVLKRPFEIGDRILVGTVKGDVLDITLTHVHLKEIGGVIASEENSGRIILVPNASLFENNIINYTDQDDFVLDEVTALVTYESDIDKAVIIAKKAAHNCIKEFIDQVKREPYIRTFFDPSGIQIKVRYFAPASRLQEFSSNVTKTIFDEFMKIKTIEFAYPHREIILTKKSKR